MTTFAILCAAGQGLLHPHGNTGSSKPRKPFMDHHAKLINYLEHNLQDMPNGGKILPPGVDRRSVFILNLFLFEFLRLRSEKLWKIFLQFLLTQKTKIFIRM